MASRGCVEVPDDPDAVVKIPRNMTKYKFADPRIVVEVSTSPLNRPEPGNPYTIYECLARPFGHNMRGPRKTYQITATSASAASRMAHHNYKADFGL